MMKCQVCGELVTPDNQVIIKTTGVKGHTEYHCECWDRVWETWLNRDDSVRELEFDNGEIV